MKAQAPICCLLAGIALGIFTDFTVGVPTFNNTADNGTENIYANAVSMEPVILKLAGIRDRAKSPVVNFYSYTYLNPTIPDLLTLDTEILTSRLSSSYFDAARLTVFVADGWIRNASSEMCTQLREEYVKNNNTNVIVVEWEGHTLSTGEATAKQVHVVAKNIARLVAKLVLFAHLDLDHTIFVGYSTGAHVMGAAGKMLEGQIASVVGLDPSISTKKLNKASPKLDRLSGKYVQVIHTNCGNLGLNGTIGSADFFANQGIHQPGCLGDDACSHKRAWQYFAESINSNTGFYGTKCSSEEYLGIIRADKNDVLPTCASGTLAEMGGLELDHKAQGIFMFETASQSPFALGVRN